MKRILITPLIVLFLLTLPASAQFTDWTAPLNLGTVVNSAYADSCASVSKNGLSLFFFSNRYAQNATAPWHLYVSKRASKDEPWGTPQEIVGFNEGFGASCPALSPDEHRLFFASNRPDRPDSCGATDIWVSRRHDRKDDFGWGPPVDLGCAPLGPNSPQFENIPAVIEDEDGTEVIYFGSGRPGLGGGDIWLSRMGDDDKFGPATMVAELSSPYGEHVAIRKDGLEAIIASNRPGGTGDYDLWTASRESTSHPWPAPTVLTILNSTAFDGGRMSFSFDGMELYFRSNRAGNADLYITRRQKLRK